MSVERVITAAIATGAVLAVPLAQADTYEVPAAKAVVILYKTGWVKVR